MGVLFYKDDGFFAFWPSFSVIDNPFVGSVKRRFLTRKVAPNQQQVHIQNGVAVALQIFKDVETKPNHCYVIVRSLCIDIA